MENKIKVTGKVQNATALGIVHAYVQMYPKSTLADIRKAFPNEIAPDKGVEELFLPLAEAEDRNKKSNTSLYFVKDARPINLADGSKIALSQIWTSTSLNNLIERAKQIGIVAEVNKETSQQMNTSGFAIEYLNGWKPTASKKGCLGMFSLLLALGSGSIWGLVELIK